MIKFGPSGNSNAFYEAGFKTTIESATWVKEHNLDCFEYSFGRGVSVSVKTAGEIKKAFDENGIEISVHAPYYINLGNPDDEMVEKSYGYLLQSGIVGKLMGANRVVFHPASQGKAERGEVVELTKRRFNVLAQKIYDEKLDDMMFCPETMGKLGQIGTVEEIATFCKIDKVFTPCVDFGHVNAREQGSLKTTKDYLRLLNTLIDAIGYERMKNFHVHFSKIEYSLKGEVRHLTFEDTVYGPEFYPLSVALKQLKLEPYIVAESAGTQDIDAIKMKEIYLE